MALYRGVTGNISVKEYKEGETTATEQFLAHMTSWNVDMTKSIEEVAYFGGSAGKEGFTEKTPGAKAWTASADGSADFGDDSGQEKIMEAYLKDTIVTGTFYLDAKTGLQGEGYIESVNISHAADGKGEMSISISGNKDPRLMRLNGTGD